MQGILQLMETSVDAITASYFVPIVLLLLVLIRPTGGAVLERVR